jgi:hypothetical protein
MTDLTDITLVHRWNGTRGAKSGDGNGKRALLAMERMPIDPALSHRGDNLLLVLSHLPDEMLIAGIFVRGCPQNHFRKHRRQIDSFLRQQVGHLASVRWVCFCGDDPVGDQLAQAICQDIGRDALIALHEFLIGTRPPQHHVADDQQRPAVAQHLHRSVQRTLRPVALGLAWFFHIFTVSFYLHFASDMLIISRVEDFPRPPHQRDRRFEIS